MRTTLKLIAAGLISSGVAGCAKKQTASNTMGSSPDSASISSSSLDAAEAGGAYDPRMSLIAEREPWFFADVEGHLITTPNFRLYTTVEDPNFLEQLPKFYESAMEHYTTSLAKLPKPPSKLETFLFKTRSQWQLKTQEMLPEQANMFSNLGRGGFTTRGTSVLYYIDRWGYPRDTFAIAAHEGWHQYTQQTFKHQLPIWLEEGIATYMEGYSYDPRSGADPVFKPSENRERLLTLRESVRDESLIPIDQLLTRSPQSFLNESKDSLLTYYAQVWALTRFLAEGEQGRYRNSLAAVLTDAADGKLVGRMMASPITTRRRNGSVSNRVGPAVAQEYFNRDLAELDRQYRAFCQHVVDTEYRSRRRRP